MPLSTYALVSLDELKTYLGTPGPAEDERLIRVINRASALVEQEVGARLVTRADLTATPDPIYTTEYHTVRSYEAYCIRVEQWPIISVQTIHEDYTRAYAAESLLTVTTDYLFTASTGEIFRVLAGVGAPRYWLTGWRAIKVVYAGGYATTALVPDDYKEVCLEIAATMYHEADKRGWGSIQVADQSRNTTRFVGYLTSDLKQRLLNLKLARRPDFGPTWEAA